MLKRAAIGFIAALGFSSLTFAEEPELDLFWSDLTPTEALAELAKLDKSYCPVMADGFEVRPDLPLWNPRFVRPANRFDLRDGFAAEGTRSLAISLVQGDLPWSKDKHKHELRIANSYRCQFGREVWYSFSFRVEGDYPLFGSTRWVIGQWKEESKASPFVAQRFDNGVFHITVQNNDKREVVAAAPGNYNASYAFFTPGFRLELESENAPRDRVEFANALIDFETRSAEGAIDVPAYKRAIEEQDLDKFPFIADRPDYRNSDTFRIVKLGENPVLPNPTDGWVNMRYRIKGGRDGTGFLEVWANGEFIVRVEGAIGSDAFDGDTQYFKIGHYRDIESAFGWATVYVDNFKRGTVRDHVD